MEKKGIIAIVAIIIVVGGSIGGYLVWNSMNQAPKDGLPTNAVPDASLKFIKGDTVQTLTLQQIVTAINDGDLTLIETDDEGDILKGINPLELYDYMGWNYVDEVNYLTGDDDGFNATISAMPFYLGDSTYNDDATGVTELLVIAVGSQWLSEYDSESGNFRIDGDDFSGKQRIKNIVNITYISDWTIKINVNDVLVATLDINNITSFAGANNTKYTWGYLDGVYSWGPETINGTTIESILSIAGIGSEQEFNLTFITPDDFSERFLFNRSEMVDGEFNKMVGDPEELLSNEGKQSVIALEIDNEPLGFENGIFRVIMPGTTKKTYFKWIMELNFEVAVVG